MELLKVFRKYVAYFHDGDVFDITQENENVVLWMESGQIPPPEMSDDLELTNRSSLRGRLHFIGVKYIIENSTPINIIRKQFDLGGIFDLFIDDNLATILIIWRVNLSKPPIETDIIEYKICANKICWENLPFVNEPRRRPVEDYQQFFKNGKISRITQIDGEIIIAIESAPISGSFSDRNFPLTSRHTMLGDLLINWPKNLIVNGNPCSSIDDFVGTAEIIDLKIGHHFFHLEIRWLTIENEVFENPVMAIDTEFGAIRMRSVYNY